MKYGMELIKDLEGEIAGYQESISRRLDKINACEFDWDDCFISDHFEKRGISLAKDKIELIKEGGCHWFVEYATLAGDLVRAKWCSTTYGLSLRAVMPDGSVVWTTAHTAKGLAKKGLKKVMCKRPAWYKFQSSGRGMVGAYTGSYVLFPSDVNYATGEQASKDPIEIKDYE